MRSHLFVVETFQAANFACVIHFRWFTGRHFYYMQSNHSLTSALSPESVFRCGVRVSINAFPWPARIPWLSFRKQSLDERESRRRWRRRRPRPQRPERITEDREECTLSMSFFQPSGVGVSFRSLARSFARSLSRKLGQPVNRKKKRVHVRLLGWVDPFEVAVNACTLALAPLTLP